MNSTQRLKLSVFAVKCGAVRGVAKLLSPLYKKLNPKWMVTVQNAQKLSPEVTVPGYVQLDGVLRGKNIWSRGPDTLMAQGYQVPAFDRLPQGQYTVDSASRMLNRVMKGRPPLRPAGLQKSASAVGIPDRKNTGDPSTLKPGTELDYVIQRHLAHRSGPHYDVRAGTPGMGLLSWATKKELPTKPGDRIALHQQPLHAWAYRSFEGQIPQGYGKGTVKTHKTGKLRITRVASGAVHFTANNGTNATRYVLVKPKTPESKSWLLVRGGEEEPQKQEISPEAAEGLLAHLESKSQEA